MRAAFSAWLLAMLLTACASYECGFSTCAQGCCANNVCYEGTGVKDGMSCLGAGGGSGGAGGGAPTPCITEGKTCTEGGALCCALDSKGDNLACVGRTCRTCVASGRCDLADSPPCCNGSCSTATGYCDDHCVYYSQPCNEASPCCKSFSGTYNDVCVNERCRFCLNPGSECSLMDTSDTCCAGLRCALKPGFSTVYTCQQ